MTLRACVKIAAIEGTERETRRNCMVKWISLSFVCFVQVTADGASKNIKHLAANGQLWSLDKDDVSHSSTPS